ncbi:MAG: Hpt domain-containing protein, partial [Pseudomonas sp.]
VNGTSVRTLLRQVDKELKRLGEQGADGINQSAPDELTKNLLFYVAKAPAQSPRIRALKEQYRLDEALPDSEVVDEERARLAGPDRDAMRSVVAALCEELVRVKDSLDLFVRSDRSQPRELDGLLAPLKQIADTLAVLGFGQPRKVILDQIDVIHGLSLGQREASDGVLMDVAGALLYVEATLAGMVGPGEDRQNEQSHLPTTDVAQIHQLVIKEARNGLEQAKDAIIEFIASQWNHEHLARVPELLTQARGGLAMIPLARAAALLNACNRYIQEQLLARKAVPNWQSLDTLADAITSVEYYLERLSEDHAAQGDLILDVAEESLEALGYPLKEKPSILDRVEEPEPVAPLADPMHEIDVLDDEAEPVVETAFEAEPSSFESDFGVIEESFSLEDLPVVEAPTESADAGTIEFSLDDLPVVAEPQQPAAESELSLSFDELESAELQSAEPETLLSLEDSWNLEELPAAPGEVVELSAFDEVHDLSALPTLDLADDEPLEWSADNSLEVRSHDLEVPALEEFSLEEAGLEELSLDDLNDNPAEWNEAELAELDLPEVELPVAEPEVAPAAPVEKPLSMADVMAAPVQAINPPAQDVPPSLLPPPEGEEPIDEDLLEVFIEEVGEVLETIAEYLPQWRANTDDKTALTEVRRAFHTLKGSGRMVRALIIGELAWAIENLLNRVLDRSIQPDDDVQQVIADVVALMPALVEEFAAKAQRQRDDVDALAATAHALARGQRHPKSEAPVSEQAVDAVGADVAEVAPAGPADAAADGDALDPQLIEIFRNEAETHLDTLVGFLADCAQELPQEITDNLQRALHTLKGSAHMAGILPIAEIATPLEKLAKEFKTNLIPMDMAEAELLHTAEQLFRVGLDQLETSPLAPIDGAPEFLERVAKLHQERLDTAQAARQDLQGSDQRDPQLISIFLSEGMDILLDAEDLLRKWREHPSERQELSALLDELTTLGRGAEMAELPQIDELCEALLDLYGAVEEGSLAVSERFFSEAEAAHEALISMMDQVAAGLQVSAEPQRVEALRQLLGEALDPQTLALLSQDGDTGLNIVELDAATAELEMAELDLGDWNEPASAELPEVELPDVELPEVELPEQEFDLSEFDALPNVQELPAVEELPVDDVLPAVEDLAAIEPAPEPVVEQAPAAAVNADPLDAEMVEIFLEEAVDILESSGQALDRWLGEPDNHLALSSLLRDLHTLKGGARMAAIRPIGDLAHELETLYEGLVDRRYNYSPVLAGLLQRSHDKLAVLLEQLQANQPLHDPAELIQDIRSFRQGGAQSLSAAAVILDDVESLEPVELDLADEAPSAEAELIAAEDELEALPLVEPVAEQLEPQEISFDEVSDTPELSAEELHDVLPEAELLEPELAADEPVAPVEEPSLELAEPEAEPVAEPEAELAAEPELEPVAEPEPVAVSEPAPVVYEAPAPTAFDDDRDPELVEIFLEEGFDIIDSSSAALQRWKDDLDNSLELESLQRDLHTLKGGARMAEIREIGDLAHELEFLYEGLGDGRLRASPGLFGLLQNCHDRLAVMLEAVRDKRHVPSGEDLIETIKRFRANPDEQLSMPSSVHLVAAAEEPSVEESEDDDILDIFLEEADDLLESMESAIGRWEEKRDDGDAVDDMLRILHTLKGGARLAGQKTLGDLTHNLEQHLTEAQQQGAPWPDSLFLDVQSGFEGLQAELDQLRQRVSDNLAAEMAHASHEPAEPEAPAAPTLPAVHTLANPIVAASEFSQAPVATKVLPFVRRAQEAALDAAARRAPQELVKVPAELLEGLVNLAGETSIFRGRVEQQVSDFGFTLGEMEATIDRVRDQLRRLDIETQSQIISRFQAEAERVGYEDFDPLEMDRHSQLQQLSRALFESASDLLELKETLAARNRDAETLLLQQARVNT